MKHLFSLAVILFLSLDSNGQMGITTGMNFAKYKLTQGNTTYKRKSIIQYNIGIFYRTPGKHLSLQPSLIYNGKGTKRAANYPVYQYRNKLQYVQLSLPVLFHGNERAGDYYFGLGPYAAVLAGAKSTAIDYDDNETTVKYKIGNSDSSDFKPMDMGLNIVWGVRVKNFGMNLQYDLGLANVSPTPNQKIKTRNFSINICVFLRKY